MGNGRNTIGMEDSPCDIPYTIKEKNKYVTITEE